MDPLAIYKLEMMMGLSTEAASAFRPYYRPPGVSSSSPTFDESSMRKSYCDVDAESSVGDTPGDKGKARRKRTTFTQQQANILENEYLADHYMARDKRTILANSLQLTENQVKTWFQNRRAKDKRDKKSEDSPSGSVTPPESLSNGTIEGQTIQNSQPTPPPENIMTEVKRETPPMVEQKSVDHNSVVSDGGSVMSITPPAHCPVPTPSDSLCTSTAYPPVNPLSHHLVLPPISLGSMYQPGTMPFANYSQYLSQFGLAPLSSISSISGPQHQYSSLFPQHQMSSPYDIPTASGPPTVPSMAPVVSDKTLTTMSPLTTVRTVSSDTSNTEYTMPPDPYTANGNCLSAL